MYNNANHNRNFRSRPQFSSSRPNSRNRARPASGIHADKYVNRTIVAQDAPAYVPTNMFSAFPLHAQLQENIARRGYTTPTPIQDQTIMHSINGRDVVGIANTGTGKTAAFLLPLLNKILKSPKEKVIILVPTRELAVQINEELRAFSTGLSIRSVLCIGGQDMFAQKRALRQDPHFVIATPGRIKDLINQHAVNPAIFSNVVLDEVDRMVDIGFIKDIQYILSYLPRPRQSLFFSATITRDVEGIIQKFLMNPITISVKTAESSDRVEQDIIKVRDSSDKFAKLNELLRQDDFRKVIIFGRTKRGVEKLSRVLQEHGFTAASIHGNKSQGQRQRALQQFKQNQLQVLVATDIAARGLDIDHVTHVINYDEPATYDDYVHRIGRTGRADQIGKALTFVG